MEDQLTRDLERALNENPALRQLTKREIQERAKRNSYASRTIGIHRGYASLPSTRQHKSLPGQQPLFD